MVLTFWKTLTTMYLSKVTHLKVFSPKILSLWTNKNFGNSRQAIIRKDGTQGQAQDYLCFQRFYVTQQGQDGPAAGTMQCGQCSCVLGLL